jgi:hypothetical protein
MNDLPSGAWLGSPAKPEREMLVEFVAMSKLPALRKEFAALSKQVAELTARVPAPEKAA